jgi:hypothetical protein
MEWNDTTVIDEAIGNNSLPKFDDANSTPVKMRMKKSNGNVVDVDILTTFLMEKLDADTLATLMNSVAPITLSVNDGKIVIGVDGTIDSTAVVFNDNSTYEDIASAMAQNKVIYYFRNSDCYMFGGTNSDLSLVFICGNKVLTIAGDGTRAESIGKYAKIFTYGETYASSDIADCFAVCDYNGNYLPQCGQGFSFKGIIGSDIVETKYEEQWSLTTTPMSEDKVLTIGVNTTTYSISDLAKYDVVILDAGGIKHLLTELTTKKAVFSGSYLVGGLVVSRTYTYDGTNWTVNDAGSLYRVKVNATSEPQYLFNALVGGNGISITGGDSDTMTIKSKTLILTWRTAYTMSNLLEQDLLVLDAEGERYQCISKTDSLITFARLDENCIKTTTYDGEVWSDIAETAYPKCYNIVVFNDTSFSIDESLPTKVYVPDEETFYDAKYEEINGVQYFTLTKDNNIFTTWVSMPGGWGFKTMTWNTLEYFIEADPFNLPTTTTLSITELGQPVLFKYASNTPSVTINIGGIMFRNDEANVLSARTTDGYLLTTAITDKKKQMVLDSVSVIETYTTETLK